MIERQLQHAQRANPGVVVRAPRDRHFVMTVGIALAVGLCCAAALAAQAQAQALADRELSLAEAVTWALEANEAILIEKIGIASSEAAMLGARGAYDPLLTVEADFSRTSTPVNSAFSGAAGGELAPTRDGPQASATLSRLLSTGAEFSLRAGSTRTSSDSVFDLLSPAWNAHLGAEFRQPLLRDRAIDDARAAIRVAAADRRLAEAALHQVVLETVAAVERSYWSLAAARGEIDVRAEAVRLADEQLSETITRIESGASPETEAAQPRAELERRRGEFLAAKEAVHRAESDLRRLILADGDDDLWAARLVPSDEVPVERAAIDVNLAMSTALASRVELEAAKSLVEKRAVENELAQNEIPQLDLVVSYDRFGLTGGVNPVLQGFTGEPAEVPSELEGGFGDSLSALVDGEFEEARIGLVLALAIGGKESRAQKELAAQARRAAEIELRRARKTVRLEVLDAAAALDTASARIDAARAAREAAEVQLSAERDRYDAGLSTNFLVLTRQNDLARAKLDEISALTDHRIADTALRRATGSLLQDRNIEIRTAN